MCFIKADKIRFGEWYVMSDKYNSSIFHKHNFCKILKDTRYGGGISSGPYCTAYSKRNESKIRSCLTCGKKPPDNIIFLLNLNKLNLK